MPAEKKASTEDQSMEEILQSIKRIIAEEGTEDSKTNGKSNSIAGSDVLELTEMLGEDDTEDAIEDEVMLAPPPPKKAEKPPIFELEEIEEAAEIVEEDEVELAEEPVEQTHVPAAPVISRPPEPKGKDILADIDSLLSEETAQTASQALKSLASEAKKVAETAPKAVQVPFRSGTTVEDLVVEALRPMLKDWLDQHLSRMVQERVDKEIKKLVD